MRCAPSSAPSKLHQSRTRTARARTLRRLSPRRRRHRSAQGLRRLASHEVSHQDQRPCKGRLLPPHRKVRPAPSSGRARGISSGGPQTLPKSRGRCSGTTWRRASRHVSLRKSQGVKSPTLRNSSPRPSLMEAQGLTSCLLRCSTTFKCHTISFSLPSLSQESPTDPPPR